MPTFRTPEDCTPWVLGGLWPIELNELTAETATVAEYLKRDLQRIADTANHRIRAISEAGLSAPVQLADQQRVIDAARAFATKRVDSTVRQLHTVLPRHPAPPTAPDAAVLEVAVPDAAEEVTAPEAAVPEQVAHPEEAKASEESEEHRLRRLVDGFARQEPGLRWAVAGNPDGTTVVLTDLAGGWIPPGIEVPAGVEVLPPGRRPGNLRALLHGTESSATYRPGDRFAPARGAAARERPGSRTVPVVEDLGWQLAEATRWRDGLPRIVHTLAKAAAAGTGVVDAELDVLRVHLDTARYQLLAGYPDLDVTVLLNCQLLAATDALAAGDQITANYHFAWFEALYEPTYGNRGPIY